jgi:NAD(P)-dependent dehydrogenase (short-subunit alcohol dehydrogenase family)
MKTFLSIGAWPGMGLATAERFAREGFHVVLSARNPTQTQDLVEQLKAHGYQAEMRTVDAGDPFSVAGLVESVERQFGATAPPPRPAMMIAPALTTTLRQPLVRKG